MANNPAWIVDAPTRADEQAYMVDLPPYNFPPADAYFFDAVDFVGLPAIGPANRVVVVSFHIPPGTTGVVKWLANVYLGGGFVDGSGDVTWRLFINNQPVQNYENIRASLGTLAIPCDTFIIVQEDQTVQFTVETALAPPGGSTTGCRLKGWYWPQGRDAL